MSARVLSVIAAAAIAAGCARPAGPPPELAAARAAIRRAESSPIVERVRIEIAEAESALGQAERAAARSPGSAEARDLAYVARRRAERARASEVYAAEVDALAAARASAERLRRNVERREEAAEDRARRTEEARSARAPLRQALRDGLDLARRSSGEVIDEPGGVRLRLPVEELFIWGTSLLHYGADSRLARVAQAVRAGPPCYLQIQILDDAEGIRADGGLLARRRVQRVRQALLEHGVPTDYFLPTERQVKPGTQIDLVITEQPVVVPPSTPPGVEARATARPRD